MTKLLTPKILLILLMSFFSTSAIAHDIEVKNADGVTIYYNWNYNWKNGKTELSVCQGEKSPSYIEYSGNVIIPESVWYNGNIHNVTSIGSGAFYGCSGLTSIAIPNSVTSIGNSAFSYCSGLTSIISKIQNPFVIENNVFYCRNKDIYATATLTVPKGTKAAYQATEGWNKFANIVESDGSESVQTKRTIHVATAGTLSNYISESEKYQIEELTLIGEINGDDLGFLREMAGRSRHGEGDYGPNGGSVFRETGGKLTSLDLSGVRIVAGGCYMVTEGADSYWSGYLREDDQIPSYLFLDCNVLTSISFPKLLASIDDYAFWGCSGLTSIVLRTKNPFTINDIVFDNSVYSAATLTVPAGTKAAYQATEVWNKFANIVEEGATDEVVFTSDGVTYLGSISNKTAVVKSVDTKLKTLEIPASVSYNGTSYQVTGIADNAFSGCTLAALIWNADAALPSNAFSSASIGSNFLLYVKSESYAPSSVKNIIVNSTAPAIVLSDDGGNFYCPQSFTARSISYTHNYSMETGGSGMGWETIALPFNVQKVSHSPRGEIVPFASYSSGSNQKPFWLASMVSSGFRSSSSIQANTPYIIAMPNNSSYRNDYILAGDVTFSAENVSVPVTPTFSGFFVPAYSTIAKSASVYALNVRNRYVTNTGNYVPGSRFISNLRDVRPFEAYLSVGSSTRGVIEIGFSDGTTGMADVIGVFDADRAIDIYTLSGQKAAQTKQSELDGILDQLPHGVYIVNGKKIVK